MALVIDYGARPPPISRGFLPWRLSDDGHGARCHLNQGAVIRNPCMGPSKSSTISRHSPLSSFQFLCLTWKPVSSSRPTRVGRWRAQGLSRPAVAPPVPHAPSFPGRALTARARRHANNDRDDMSEGSPLSGTIVDRTTTLYSVD